MIKRYNGLIRGKLFILWKGNYCKWKMSQA